MKITSLVLMLETNDLPATIDFYTTLLGFEVVQKLEEEGQIAWASLINKEGVEIMFKTPNEVMNYGTILLTGNIYLQTDNAAEWWQKLKDKVDVMYDLEAFSYGMLEFGFKDNNGYVISIGSERGE
jgi:uncharacterized glyoxalase superfamily protein PhnB